ncbi:hypothetical protein N780_05815 [Pontibacillus chungwhensis BH030062]|uniref:SbsA Ig-like domain-containing protein n=1 Tax=Pontibacillus chungwhensis BH030062 TaxID=1385513 RepID=A0A0A2UUY3_9BACI|nr:hypothetical protein [Pontibacillus chungwhensis]KGP90291.1 hypothetical protein N780_05815 [Pontibacillus chungwhensis BH030062]
MERYARIKSLKGFMFISLFIFLLLGAAGGIAAEEKEWTGSEKVVPADKKWTITFNTSVVYDQNSSGITVEDQSGTKVNVTVKQAGEEKVEVLPPAKGYTAGKSYVLRIKDIASTQKVKMKDDITMTFTIEEPSSTNKQTYIDLVESTNSTIRNILVSGWDQETLSPGDFSDIEGELEKVATVRFIQDTLKPYFEAEMCYPCDSSMFPFSIAPDLHFKVIKATKDERIFQTAELSDELSEGKLVTYTFKNEDGKWLLDDYKEERFSGDGLGVSAEAAQDYLNNLYLNQNYGYENVVVTYLEKGEEEQYDWYSNRSYNREYYVFQVNTDKGDFKRKFFPFDGYIVYLKEGN